MSDEDFNDEGFYYNGYAADIIEGEGVGYAVLHYIDGDSFADPETRRLWNEAEQSLNALLGYLHKQTGRDLSG